MEHFLLREGERKRLLALQTSPSLSVSVSQSLCLSQFALGGEVGQIREDVSGTTPHVWVEGACARNEHFGGSQGIRMIFTSLRTNLH